MSKDKAEFSAGFCFSLVIIFIPFEPEIVLLGIYHEEICQRKIFYIYFTQNLKWHSVFQFYLYISIFSKVICECILILKDSIAGNMKKDKASIDKCM